MVAYTRPQLCVAPGDTAVGDGREGDDSASGVHQAGIQRLILHQGQVLVNAWYTKEANLAQEILK